MLYYFFLKDWFPETSGAELLLLAALGGLLALFSQKKYYHPEKKPWPLYLRVFILLEALIFLYHKFFREGAFPPDFAYIDTSLLFCLLFPLISWLLSLSLYSRFLFREYFYHLLLQKGRVHIKDQLRNLGYYMGETLGRLNRMEWLVRLLLLMELVFLGIVFTWFRPFGNLSALMLTANSLLLAYWLFLLKQTRENDLLLGDGVLLSPESRKGEGRLYLVLTVLMLLGALVLSGTKPLLDLRLIGRFFLWLKSKIRFTPIDIQESEEMPEISQDTISSMEMQQNLFEQMPQREPWHMPEEIKKALLILLGILAGALFIYYMVYPLFKRKRRRSGRTFSLRWMGQRFLEDLRDFFHSFTKRKKSEVLRVEWDDKKEDLKQEGLIPTRSKAHKAAEHRGMRRNFHRICRWGKKKNLPFRRGLSPEEYCRFLADALPEYAEAFQKTARIFEIYYYAPQPPPATELAELEQWIKKLEKRRLQA